MNQNARIRLQTPRGDPKWILLALTYKAYLSTEALTESEASGVLLDT